MFYYSALFISFGATLASILFIEILGNPAAPLCWFERMLMFGLLLILTIGLVRKDISARFYAIPFIILGTSAAFYQQLVHWGIINLYNQGCSINLVCTTKFFNLFGVISQSTLCLTAFILIAFCLYKTKKFD
jgi:disulfide bond formation protein DsbB